MTSSSPFCCAPFSQLLLRPDGKITPCCYLYGHVVGDVAHRSILDIWNGAKLRKLRREFLSGNVRTCRGRIQNIACHEEFARFASQISLTEEQKEAPKRLDVRLGGKCNLKCIMCDVWRAPNGRYEASDLWTKGPRDIFPYLTDLEIAGGEPFVQRDVYRLITEVSQVNKDCQWSFITNGSYRFSGKLRRVMNSISIRRIQLSLDSLDESTYSMIRPGGIWSKTMQALMGWLDYRAERTKLDNGFMLQVSMCVLSCNWHEIPAMLTFCENHDVRLVLQFAYHDPSGHSLIKLSWQEQEQIVKTLLSLPAEYRPVVAPIVNPLAHAIRKSKLQNESIVST